MMEVRTSPTHSVLPAAQWHVRSCRERKLLFMRISGFFTEADVRGFARDVAEHINRMRPLPASGHVSVCDATGMVIQSKEAAAAFAAMLDHPAARSRRLAYIAGSTLAKIQMRRLTNRDDIAFFDDVASAETWALS